MLDPIVSLEIVDRELTKLRFAAMDQNPHGIRDLLTSAIYKLKEERRTATELFEAARAIHGSAKPRARYAGGPAVECTVDKPLIDALTPILKRS